MHGIVSGYHDKLSPAMTSVMPIPAAPVSKTVRKNVGGRLKKGDGWSVSCKTIIVVPYAMQPNVHHDATT